MSEPLEIIGAPLTLWLAPTGTAFPAIDDAASTFDAAWQLVGINGDKDYTEDGVTVTHTDTLTDVTPSGGTGKIKKWRTDEDLTIEVTVMDLTADTYALVALNDNAVETVTAAAGIAGEKIVPLMKGLDVAEFALLARGISSEMEGGNAQYQVPRVVQTDNPALAYKKGNPVGLKLTFEALDDVVGGGGFGELHIQTAAATGS